jgi:hypothetical protein
MQGMAQNKLAYTYDMAGNRLTRKLVTLANPNYAKRQVETPIPTEDQLSERKIIIYPNPTKGNLAVEITGGDSKDELRIILFSAQGIQLQNVQAISGVNPVEMSAYSAGWYIMRIIAGDKTTEFKIVKE